MSNHSSSLEFPAEASRLAEIRRFVSDNAPHEAERLRLLVSELATLMLGVAPRITLTVVDHGERVEIRLVPDAVKEGTSLEPAGYVRKVIEALADEFTIHLDDDDPYMSAMVVTSAGRPE